MFYSKVCLCMCLSCICIYVYRGVAKGGPVVRQNARGGRANVGGGGGDEHSK
jgi:hypothetical protein